MDTIKKAILFEGKAIVSVLDTTNLVKKAVKLHKTKELSSVILGKMLTMAAFMSSGFKGEQNKVSITLEGDGKAGKIVVAGDYGTKVRGYIQNGKLEYCDTDKTNKCDANDNKGKIKDSGQDFDDCIRKKSIAKRNAVGEAVGKNGKLVVIKDFGMGEPYVGTSELVNGNIDEDFMLYFTISEQLPSVVSTAVKMVGDKVVCAGGIIVQPMPNCGGELIVILQDIVRNFTDFGLLLSKSTPEEILEENFGHFDIKHLPEMCPTYECKCSEEKIKNLIFGLGRREAEEILQESGKIEVFCEFCNTFYTFDKAKVAEIFSKS